MAIFRHLKVHNNEVMSGMLSQVAINKRNRVNAISLYGLLICWSLEVFHMTLAGFLALIVGGYWNRVLSVFIRYLEFVLVPLVQIYTSPPIRRFVGSLEA